MHGAAQFGYKFEVLHGYLFESEQIFKKYITDMYKIKENSLKSEAMYLISKLLMNSLFGRFALHYNLGKTEIVNDEMMKQMARGKIKKMVDGKEDITKVSVSDIHDFKDGFHLVTFTEDKDIESEDYKLSSKSSVNIAVAITALARVNMSQFKKPDMDYNLYYTDTDSIFIDKPLDPSFIEPEIGKMKLEYIFKE